LEVQVHGFVVVVVVVVGERECEGEERDGDVGGTGEEWRGHWLLWFTQSKPAEEVGSMYNGGCGAGAVAVLSIVVVIAAVVWVTATVIADREQLI
jgi:hypothetical protein